MDGSFHNVVGEVKLTAGARRRSALRNARMLSDLKA